MMINHWVEGTLFSDKPVQFIVGFGKDKTLLPSLRSASQGLKKVAVRL